MFDLDSDVSVVTVIGSDGIFEVEMFEWSGPPCWRFEQPPVFFWHNLSNLDI